jgi:hypothetical protein
MKTPTRRPDLIAAKLVEGRGTCFRAAKDEIRLPQGDVITASTRRTKDLVLSGSALESSSIPRDVSKQAQIFHLEPGPSRYENVAALRVAAAYAGDTIYPNMRSVLQIMTFRSKGASRPPGN